MNWLMKAARFANLAAAVGSISRCWRRHVVSHSALDLFRIFFYWFSATSLFLLLHSSSSLSFLVFFFRAPVVAPLTQTATTAERNQFAVLA